MSELETEDLKAAQRQKNVMVAAMRPVADTRRRKRFGLWKSSNRLYGVQIAHAPKAKARMLDLKKVKEMDKLEIKSPWEMIWIEYADEIIAQIKDALPSDHELQKHDIFPGIKWHRHRFIFIVDDDTTGERMLMNFEKPTRWKNTKRKAPTIRIFENQAEIAAMIERDHQIELSQFSDDEAVE